MGLYKVLAGPTVVTTLSISLVWIVYSAVPPYLLLHYAWVHRPDGRIVASLRYACWILWLLSSFCGVAAILLLWLVYPKQVRVPFTFLQHAGPPAFPPEPQLAAHLSPHACARSCTASEPAHAATEHSCGWPFCAQYDYGQVMGMSFDYYSAERIGHLPANYSVPWRGSAFLQEGATKVAGFGNMTGGFMTGGSAGTVKLTLPTAFTLSMLAWGMLEFPEVRLLRQPRILTCALPDPVC